MPDGVAVDLDELKMMLAAQRYDRGQLAMGLAAAPAGLDKTDLHGASMWFVTTVVSVDQFYNIYLVGNSPDQNGVRKCLYRKRVMLPPLPVAV